MNTGFCELNISQLVKADWNYKVDNEALAEKLANNIKRNGQIENIIVRELDKEEYKKG
jgi:ParB-like chromosome segregation protein Spo0J